MEIIKELVNNTLKVGLEGRLDTTTAPELEQKMTQEFTQEFNELIFDFEKLGYISSAGLRVMLMCQKEANTLERKMRLINVKPELLEVFEVTGFTDILNIE